MHSMRPLALAPLLALALLRSNGAMAQTPEAASGRSLFHEARALFEQGRTDEACVKFEQSERIDPAPGTELGLAACWEKQGRLASAWAMFGRAERSAIAANRGEWAEHARGKRAELEASLPRLRLRMPGGSAPGLELRLDGAAIANEELANPIPVDPGSHRLDATRPDHRSWTTTVSVGAGAQIIDVDVPALQRTGALAAASRGAAEAPVDASIPPLRIAGIATAGAGAVGVAIGAYFGVSAFSYDSDARDDCPTPTTCGQRGLDATDSARSAATASTVAFALGAAAIVGGIVMIVVAPKASGRPRTTALEVSW
jgi:hypothetical protein